MCTHSLAGLGSSCRHCPRVACGTRPGERLGVELPPSFVRPCLPCPSEGVCSHSLGFGNVAEQMLPWGHSQASVREGGGPGRTALPSSLRCGCPGRSPRKSVTPLGQRAWPRLRCCRRAARPLCLGAEQGRVWEAAWASGLCSVPVRLFSDGPGRPWDPMCSVLGCWSATQGQAFREEGSPWTEFLLGL